MNLPSILPESFLRCLSPQDRKRLASGHCRAEEALSRSQAKSERELQTQIVNLLRLKGIEPLVPSYGKKTRMAIGWPDITFAVQGEPYIDGDGAMCCNDRFACAWEVKFGDGKLSHEQEQMHVRLSTPPNNWRILVIKSIDQALQELRNLGIE